MPDHPLVKGAKVLGWNWLGEQFGVPVRDVVGDVAQGVRQDLDQIIQENQNLRRKLLQAASSYLQRWQEFQGQVSQLQKEHEELRRQVEQGKAQAPAQFPSLPEARKEARLELSASKWLEVMPAFARWLILGMPGSGKSATGHMLLELHRWKAAPYILGFPKEKERLLPSWLGLSESFDKIPPGSIVLVDEAYLLYHAGESGFDKGVREMSGALGLARQRGHSILFVAHEARHLDKNIGGYANLFVIKEPGAREIKAPSGTSGAAVIWEGNGR